MPNNNNNYCFIKPTNSFTTPDPNGITDNSSNNGMIDDGSSTTNPNQGNPNNPNINTEISIFKQYLPISQTNINDIIITPIINNSDVTNINGNSNYNNFLVSGYYSINGDTIDSLNEGYYYITFICYNNNIIKFQDDKLYKILGVNQIKNYGFNFVLPNHDKIEIKITDPSSNINQTTTLFTKGFIKCIGLLKP